MPYRTSFMDMAYPDEAGRPCALQFRIALTAATERLAVVHLLETRADYQGPMESYIVRDQILNRILEIHLRGVPLNAIRLVVESGGQSSLFPIDFDVGDYIKRGNPYEATHVTTSRGLFRERARSGPSLSSPGAPAYRPATPSPLPSRATSLTRCARRVTRSPSAQARKAVQLSRLLRARACGDLPECLRASVSDDLQPHITALRCPPPFENA